MALKELYEQRQAFMLPLQELRKKADSEAGWTAEDRGNWDKLNADLGAIELRIQDAEAVEKRLNDLGNSKPLVLPGREDGEFKRSKSDEPAGFSVEKAFGVWCRSIAGEDVTPEEALQASRLGFSTNRSEVRFNLGGIDGPWALGSEVSQRAISTDASGTPFGGYSVPVTLSNSLEIALKNYGSVRNVATVLRTATGEVIDFPTTNDTSNKGSLIAENTDVGADVNVVFGKTSLTKYIIHSGIVPISVQLLRDSVLNLPSIVGGLLGERIARKCEEFYTTGTGSSQPQGVVVGSTLGKTAASPTAITADEIIDLIYSVDPAYHGSARIMCHTNIAAALRKLKDSQGQYLWQPSVQAGMPPTLHGFPVSYNQEMQATIATATRTVLFGDFSRFMVREIGSVRLKWLKERYAEKDQEAFIAYFETDSRMLNAGTNPIKHLIQA